MAPVAFPCIPPICGGIPGLPKLPSVGDIIKLALKQFLQLFTGSAQSNLKTVLHAVTSTPVANLRAAGFLDLYGKVYGLVVILIVPGILINTLLVSMHNRREETPISGVISGGKILLAGAVLPGAVGFGVTAAQFTTKLFVDIFSHTPWQGALTQNSSIGDIMSDLGLTVWAWVLKMDLLVEIIPIQMSVYLFTLLGILAYVTSVIRGHVGSFSRWMWAGLATGIVLQPLLALTLGLGGAIIGQIGEGGGGEPVRTTCVFMLLIIALVEPFVLFWVSNKRIKAFIENRANIKGEVEIKEQVEVRQQRQDQQASLNAQLANITSNSSDGGGDSVMGGALRAGTNTLVDTAVKGAAMKVAASTLPVAGVAATGITYAHHKYMQKRDNPANK